MQVNPRAVLVLGLYTPALGPPLHGLQMGQSWSQQQISLSLSFSADNPSPLEISGDRPGKWKRQERDWRWPWGQTGWPGRQREPVGNENVVQSGWKSGGGRAKEVGWCGPWEVVHLETTLTQSYRPPIVSTLYFSLWTVMLCYIKIVLY